MVTKVKKYNLVVQKTCKIVIKANFFFVIKLIGVGCFYMINWYTEGNIINKQWQWDKCVNILPIHNYDVRMIINKG